MGYLRAGQMMPMGRDRGLILRNERVPEFTYIMMNRAISANYEFFIRGFSIWDNVETDPRALKEGHIEYPHAPVFADTPARLQICGTEKVGYDKSRGKLGEIPIKMVFQQLLRPTLTDRGITYIREDSFKADLARYDASVLKTTGFKGNFTQSKGELCTISTYSATQDTKS
jgi:hypothetical protein